MNNQIKKILFFLLCLGCFQFQIYGQEIKLQGKVVFAENNNIIEGVSIVIENKNEIIGYTYTNSYGMYSLSVDIKNKDSLVIKANNLGRKEEIKTFSLVNGVFEYTVNFQLKEEGELLEEVLIKTGEKIRINRDTIVFKAAAFKSGDEKTVEDLLKNIPGIEVSEDGSIRALGKPIQKLLIEGDDLAGSKYGIVSKNLDVSVLKEVEILNNYEENKVLKQFLNSESVAINLKLKDDKKSILFGKTELGGGIENRYVGDADIGLISPSFKMLNLTGINNIGLTGSEAFTSHQSISQGFNDFNKDFGEDTESIVVLEGNTISLEKKTYVENQTLFDNILLNKKLSKNTKLRNSLYFYKDGLDQDYASRILYANLPESFNFEESNSFSANQINISNELEITYAPSENINLNFQQSFKFQNDQNRNDLIFNSDQIENRLDQNIRDFESQLQITKKIGSGILVAGFYTGYENRIQDFRINPISLLQNPSVITESENTSIHSGNLIYQGAEFDYVLKKNKSLYSLTYGIKNQNEYVESVFINTIENIDNARQDFLNLEQHVRFKTELPVLENLVFNGFYELSHNQTNNNSDKQDFLWSNVLLRLRLKNTGFGSFQGKYTLSSDLPNFRDLVSYSYISNYRSIRRGLVNAAVFSKQQWYASYLLSQIKKQFSFDISISHTLYGEQLSQSKFLSTNFDENVRVIINGSKLSLLKTGLTTYVNSLESSMKIGYSKQFSETPQLIDEQQITFKTATDTYYIRGTSYFNFPLNFKWSAEYARNTSEAFELKTSNERYKFSLKSILKIKNRILGAIDSRFFIINGDFYQTTNMNFEYKTDTLTFGFLINNVVGTDDFVFSNVQDFNQTDVIFQAVPRYFVVNTSFRF